MNQHNVTLVIAAMREGEAKKRPEKELRMAEQSFEGKVSMINRMATFIKATTEELEEANRKLSELAVTDAMTSAGNKTAYIAKTRSLDEQIRQGTASFTVFVFDVNGLKAINDSFGHERGDLAISDTANVLKSVFGIENLYRIGGDEFIAIVGGMPQAELERLFRELEDAIARQNQSERPYGVPLAVSKGAAIFSPGEDREYLEVFRRADTAMYKDKKAYYLKHDRRKQ